MAREKFQHQKMIEQVEFYLNYRIKIFQFFVIINSALISVLLTIEQVQNEIIVIPILGFFISVAMLMAEFRSVCIGDRYRAQMIKLEKELGLWKLYAVHKRNLETGPQFRTAFRSLYLVLIIMWILAALYYCKVWSF